MPVSEVQANLYREAVLNAIERETRKNGGPKPAINPGHRLLFRWPPHSVTFDYHIMPSEFTHRAQMTVHGETHEVEVARTPFGVFGRCPSLWHDARGEDEDEMLVALEDAAEPLYNRYFAVASALGKDQPVKTPIRELAPTDWLQLLYCADRSLAHEAALHIETHPSPSDFGPALIAVLQDEAHPQRRSAQWEALDLFEDFPAFARNSGVQTQAIEAMRNLLLRSDDDCARTIFKAGVVLGGHICSDEAASALFQCLHCDNPIGRRSAIHAVFHLAEWRPDLKERILEELARPAGFDPEPVLAEFAQHMIRDIALGEVDHMMEPTFENET